MSIFNEHGIGTLPSQLEEYAERHFQRLDDLLESLKSEQTSEEYKRLSATVNLDASGNGNTTLISGQGYGQKLERVAFVVVGGATVGMMTVHTNSVAPGTLIENAAGVATSIAGIGACVVYADAFDNSIYVSDQEQIVVQFNGYTANTEAYVNIQTKLLKEPGKTHHRSTYFNGSM